MIRLPSHQDSEEEQGRLMAPWKVDDIRTPNWIKPFLEPPGSQLLALGGNP